MRITIDLTEDERERLEEMVAVKLNLHDEQDVSPQDIIDEVTEWVKTIINIE